LSCITITQAVETLQQGCFESKVSFVASSHAVFLAMRERAEDVCHMINI
jgi:hypothetical protein